MFTSSNLEVPAAQRCLGNQDITIVAAPAVTINSLLSQMQGMQESLAIALEPRFRNTATQILLHAAGQESFRLQATDCDYFAQLGASHNGVQSISQVMGVPSARFVGQADAVIKRRNAFIHPLSLSALEEEVGKLQGQISAALQRLCKWECDVVLHYDAFKEAFPGRFV